MLISKLECTKIIIIVFFQPILQDSGVLIIIKTWSKYRTNIITGGEGSALFKKNYYTNTLVFLAQKSSTNKIAAYKRHSDF